MFSAKVDKSKARTFVDKYLPGVNRAAAKKTFEEYAEKTTIHGIRYLKDSKYMLERLWWIIVIATSITVCTIFIVNIYKKWNRSPVIVSFAAKPTAAITVNVSPTNGAGSASIGLLPPSLFL